MYNGAIDCIVLSKYGNKCVFFLDNHMLQKYCSISSEGLEKFFAQYLEKDSCFFLEEPMGDVNVKKTFDSPHLEKFDKFVEEHRDNEKFKWTDVRILLQNQQNLHDLFSGNYENNEQIRKIWTVLDNASYLSKTFNEYYNVLKDKYGYLFGNSTHHFSEIPSLNTGYPLYPFISSNLSRERELELFYSSLFELYTVAELILNCSQINLFYMGALHCITISSILVKYFGYKVNRDISLENIGLEPEPKESFRISDLDKLKVSCVKYKTF